MLHRTIRISQGFRQGPDFSAGHFGLHIQFFKQAHIQTKRHVGFSHQLTNLFRSQGQFIQGLSILVFELFGRSNLFKMIKIQTFLAQLHGLAGDASQNTAAT